LSKLGRGLNKTIIIDNLPENFKLQPNNGFGIRTWDEDIKDTQLFDLGKILKGKITNNKIVDIYTLKIQDVRVVIKKIKEEVGKKILKNVNQLYLGIDISKFI